MEKRPKQNYDLLFFGILTFLATTTWVVFEVYRSIGQKSEAVVVAEAQTRQLTPTLDTTVLGKLEKRIVAEEMPQASEGGTEIR